MFFLAFRSRHPLNGAALVAAGAMSVLFAMAGCAPNNARAHSNSAAIPTGTGSRVITREQIAELNVLDAYAVIERLGGYRLSENNRGGVSIRQRRGQSSFTNTNADRPVLVIDGAQVSDFELLHRIRVSELERIELVSPGDATQRYGTMSSGAGAIIVVTRSR